MRPNKKIKVLVVDDSILFRELLFRGLSKDPGIEVVAMANDPYEARDKIIEYQPDVMTCDIEMPKMNGIDFIRLLMPQYPLPVIVVSMISDAVFDAMNAGAIDFVAKPDVKSLEDMEKFIKDMTDKVKIAAQAKIQGKETYNPLQKIISNLNSDMGRIIAIGASTGGTEAIFNILKNLSGDVPGIVIVQHIPPGFSQMFAERLDTLTSLSVKEGKTGDIVRKGNVVLAPGGKHMTIKKFGGDYKVKCFEGEKVNGHRPSADVLFESVAQEAGKKAIGIILTGMGSDGAKGLLAMKQKGAKTIGQDEKTSVVYGMPKAAYEIGAVETQVPLDNISNVIHSILAGR